MASIFDMDPEDLPPRVPDKDPKRGKFQDRLTQAEVNGGRRKLADMVAAAFQTLESALKESDFPTAIKAAQIILDRAGFGPKSTVDVNQVVTDLSSLTREELAQRATQIADELRAKDVTKTTVN